MSEEIAKQCEFHADGFLFQNGNTYADTFRQAAATLRALTSERDAALAEIDRMRSADKAVYDAVKQLELRVDRALSEVAKLQAERDALQAENERLRAELSFATDAIKILAREGE